MNSVKKVEESEIWEMTQKLYAVKNVCETVIAAIGEDDYPTRGCMVLIIDTMDRLIDQSTLWGERVNPRTTKSAPQLQAVQL